MMGACASAVFPSCRAASVAGVGESATVRSCASIATESHSPSERVPAASADTTAVASSPRPPRPPSNSPLAEKIPN
eukprot:6026900-Prymnesium_polylepis.1